jgi:hypothetical protein
MMVRARRPVDVCAVSVYTPFAIALSESDVDERSSTDTLATTLPLTSVSEMLDIVDP